MASLATCIRRAGKALNAGDATAIREIYDDYLAQEMPAAEAAQTAVNDYLGVLATEREDITGQVAEAGGVVPGEQEISYARTRSVEQDIADKLRTDRIVDGAEPPFLEGKNTNPTIAAAVDARVRRANNGRSLEARTKRNKEIISTVLADEIDSALRREGNAGLWYKESIGNTVRLIEILHPEIAEDTNMEAMFLAGLAITSSQTDVATNAARAEQVYAEFKKTGKFPLVGWGTSTKNQKKAFNALNTLVENVGMSEARRFLATEFSVGELKELGFLVSDELIDTVMHGSGIFGPKIGAGFYQNLIGNFDPLTMDRWFMKTWGRIVGDSLPDPSSEANLKRQDKFKNALLRNPAKMAELGVTAEALEEQSALLDAAKVIYRQFSRGNFKDKTPVNETARNVENGLAPKVYPSGGAERNWIREVMGETQAKLKQRGLDYDMATLQALLWYPEKELWAKLGAENVRAQPTDYEAEYKRILRERGVTPQRISGAIRRGASRRPRGTVPGDAGDIRRGGLEEAYSPKEREYVLQRAVVHSSRRANYAPWRGGAGSSQGRLVGKTLLPNISMRNAYKRVGIGTPRIKQMQVLEESVEMFESASNSAIKAHPQSFMLETYDRPQLMTSQIYLADDRMSGFAIKGGDIVNLFTNPNSKYDHQMISLLSAAVHEGGRRYENFEVSPQPEVLAMAGFFPVARIPFDPDRAPEGWDVDTQGTPDFVYYAYDPENYNDWTPGMGAQVATNTEARDLQIEESLSRQVDPGPIRYRWDDDASEDMANSRPDNPLSVQSKLAGVMADNAEYGPSVVDQMREIGKGISNISDATIKPLLGSVPTNAVSDFMPDERMSAADEWGAELHAMEGTKNVMMMQYEDRAKRWSKFVSQNPRQGETLGQVMHAATLAGVDPAERYTPAHRKPREKWTEAEKKEDAKRRGDYAILQDYWKKLDPEAQQIYRDVRDDYTDFRSQILAQLEARIDEADASAASRKKLKDELRRKFEEGRQRVYFPLMRHGELWASAKDPETGELVAFSKFETRSTRNDWRKEMEKLGYETEGGKDPKNFYQQSRQVDPAFAAKVNELLKDIPGGEALQDEIHQIWLRQLPEMSIRKQFIHRKGTLGFSMDAMRNYAKYMFHGTAQLARLKHQSKMERHLVSLQDQAAAAQRLDDKHSDWAMPIFNEMVRRHQMAMNPPEGKWSNMATSLGFAWYLGATPAAALVNMTQTAIVGLPVLAAKNGSARSAMALTVAGKQMMGLSLITGDARQKLRGDELAAYEEAYRNGVFEKTQAHDLAGQMTAQVGPFGTWQRKLMDFVSVLFHRAEQWNRNTTFLAAYRLAKKRGLSQDAAIKEATEMTWMSHFDYSQSNRPPLMQEDVMRVVLLFKNYGLNMTYRMGRDFKNGFAGMEGLSDADKKEARSRFMGMMMMTGVMGGISSLPFAFAVEAALNAALGDDDEPVDAANEFKQYLIRDMGLSPEVVQGILRGPVDQVFGANISDRVSLSYLALAREAPGNMQGRDLWHFVLEEAAGPVPGIVGSGFAAYDDFKSGMPERGWEKLAPKSLRDLQKVYRYMHEGALNYQQQPILSPEAFTNKDLFVQAMGFTPSRLTEQYDQSRELRGMVKALQDRRRWHMDNLAMAYRTDDKQAQREAMQGILKWNKAQPTLAIDYDTIYRSVMGRLERDARALSGEVLPDNLWYLEEQMRWAPKYRKGQAEPVE